MIAKTAGSTGLALEGVLELSRAIWPPVVGLETLL